MKITLLKIASRLAACFALPCAFAAISTAPTRPDALRFVTSLRDQNVTHLKDLDKTLGKKMDTSEKTLRQSNLEADIEKLRNSRTELLMRQDFLDRLAFQFDTKYEGTHIKEFLQQVLANMAKIEVTNENKHNLWKFLSYLSVAIKSAPDRPAEVLPFLEGYMKQTSLAEPLRPEEYLASQAYSNGSQSEAAHPMDKTIVGEYAEKKVRESQATQIRTRAPRP